MSNKRIDVMKKTMKAIVATAYGGPEVLQIKDVPKPIIKEFIAS